MGKKKNEAPKQVKLTPKQAEELKERLQENELTEDDVKLLQGLLNFSLWLQDRLSRAKLTIKRLQKLFGFKNESSKKSKKNKNEDSESPDAAPDEETSTDNSEATVPETSPPPENNQQPNNVHHIPQWDDSKNHGRLSVKDYGGCEDIEVKFTDEMLLAGKCPVCVKHYNTESKIFPEDSKVIVLLEGKPLVCGKRYYFQRGRCGVCNKYFTAPLPKDIEDEPKYAPSAKSNIAINHYYGGLPFKRIEMLQAASQVPLPDATQCDLMNDLYQSSIKPIAEVLRQYGANGEMLYFDDTTARILEQIQRNKVASSKKAKKAVHGTAMLSLYGGHRIYLFDTNTNIAKHSVASLLANRTTNHSFTTMSDASVHNFPTLDDNLAARWIITLCLSHGRRRFFDLLGDQNDDDIRFVLECIAKIYKYERYCKQQLYDPEQRLQYHQQHSGPLIEALRIWLNNLLFHQLVEPNSPLGEAVAYMLKRWFWLTQFLRVAGAPLDNNLCEQTIKVLIRYRKNSLFYRTFYGATMGDAMMGVMHTAVHAGANLFHYLNSLQEYTHHVQDTPDQWLPWNYEQTIKNLAELNQSAQAA